MHSVPLSERMLRSVTKVTLYRDNLIKHHDEIADLKSYFDGVKNDDFDQQNLISIVV